MCWVDALPLNHISAVCYDPTCVCNSLYAHIHVLQDGAQNNDCIKVFLAISLHYFSLRDFFHFGK